MTLLEVFAQPMWQKLAFVLLHFAWQGLLVGVLTAIVVRLIGQHSAETRHRCYLAGLLVMTACPLVTFWVLDRPAAVQPVANQIESEPVSHLARLHSVETGSGSFERDAAIESGFVPVASVGTQIIDASSSEGTAVAGWHIYLLMVWLTGVCCLSGRMLMGFAVLRGLRRESRPLPGDFMMTARRLSRQLGMSRLPGLGISSRLGSAMATGVFRPLILLPASWLMELPADVLEAVIAHELAHIRRRDLWINLLSRSVEALLFYHPAVWWVTGALRRERELCCDELAVSVTGGRADYARALECIAQRTIEQKNVKERQPVLAAGMGGKKMALLDRVRHVLGVNNVNRRTSWWSAGAVALAVPVLFWAISLAMRPAVADEKREGDRPAAEERADGERERGPRDGERREREGDRERDGDRRERDGDRREGARERDRDRPGVERREIRILRFPQVLEDGTRKASREDLLRIIEQLRREVAEMRRHMRGPRQEWDRPGDHRPPIARRDGDGPPWRGPRDGEGPRKAGPRDSYRPPARDGDRRPEGDRPREGDRPPLRLPRREGDRPREGGPRPDGPPGLGRPQLPPEVLNLIRELRGEVQKLRRDVNELRGDGPRPERKTDRPEREGDSVEEATDEAKAESDEG